MCVVLIVGCTPDVAGTSDDTSTGTRGAVVLNPDRTPATGARISVFSSGDTSRIPVRTLESDQQGRYAFDAQRGYYSFWVEKDSFVAFEDSILIIPMVKDSKTVVLSPSVVLEGTIRMQPGDDPRSTYVGVLGTFKYTNMDQQGGFRIPGVAPGTYTLRFVSTLPEYTPTFRSVDVLGDSAVQNVGTVEMIYTGIPSVRGIRAAYDSVSGLSRVSWQQSTYPYVDRYVVYRGLASEPQSEALQVGMTHDTVFIDTTVLSGLNGRAGARFRYTVAILTEAGTIGKQFLSSSVDAYHPVNLLKLLSPQDLESFTPGSNVSFTWASVRGATEYRVQVSSTRDFLAPIEKETSDTVTMIQTLSNGGYFWRLRARSVSGDWGPWSTVRQFGLGVFAKKIADLNESDGAVAMTGIKDGVILAIPEISTSRVRVSRLDSLGNSKWSGTVSLSDGKKVSHVSISSLPDGAVLCVNASSSSSTSYDETVTVIGLDLSGGELWRRQFDGWSSRPLASRRGEIIGIGFVNHTEGQMWYSDAVLMNKDGANIWSKQLSRSFQDPPVVIPQEDSSAIVGYCADSVTPNRKLIVSRVKNGAERVLLVQGAGMMPIRPVDGWQESDGASYLAMRPYSSLDGALVLYRISPSDEVSEAVRRSSYDVLSVDRSSSQQTFMVAREPWKVQFCFYGNQMTEQGCFDIISMSKDVRGIGVFRGAEHALVSFEGIANIQGTRPLYLVEFGFDQRSPMVPSALLE